jgi:hypothetical protein
MPSVSTVIESIFGTLPGKLAGSLISVIGESISSEKKITLYDYRSFHMKMLRDYYAAKTGINFFSMTTIKK